MPVSMQCLNHMHRSFVCGPVRPYLYLLNLDGAQYLCLLALEYYRCARAQRSTLASKHLFHARSKTCGHCCGRSADANWAHRPIAVSADSMLTAHMQK